MSEFAVVMPVGPKVNVSYFADTIESIRYWCGDCRIICIDDTKSDWLKALNSVEVIQTELHGRLNSLYRNLCKGFLRAISDKQCKVVLKMDTDALVIGQNPFVDAQKFFDANPNVGSIGTFVHAPYERELQPHIELFRKEIVEGNETYRLAWGKARSHSYMGAFHCQGGCHFVSRAALESMAKNGYLDMVPMTSQLEDDLVFGLFLGASGYEHADLDCVASCWQGLWFEPQVLINRGYKCIHSVEYSPAGTKENQIRELFKSKRK